VLNLFERALALKIPHNMFAAWMVAPLPGVAGAGTGWTRYNTAQCRDAPAAVADRYRPVEKDR